jgi:acetyltransferase-like isoleucine patch superfamily enzyme
MVNSKYKLGRRMMLKGAIYHMIWMGKNINITLYLYLNYFCKSVKREKRYHIFPYKGSSIHIRSNAQIILNGDLLFNALNDDSPYARSYLSMFKNSKMIINGYVYLSHGSLIRVNPNAVLEFMGKVTSNINLTIDCKELIRIGNDTMMGSNVIIYDSDFHPIEYANEEFCIHTSPVYIGDHVWIGTRAMIMKGSNIGMGSIIGANAYFTGNVTANTLVSCIPSRTVLKEAKWARDMSSEAVESARMYVDRKVD